MNYRNIAIGILAIVLLAGAYFYPNIKNTVVENYTTTVGSSVGTTFNTAKLAEIVWSPSTASATSTSILNGDAGDRIVTDNFAYCSGIGTSFTAYTGAPLTSLGVTLRAATTSTNAPNTVTNTNFAMNTTFATTTPGLLIASSSAQVGPQLVWASGSYMTFFLSATNTASCLIGVHYLAS